MRPEVVVGIFPIVFDGKTAGYLRGVINTIADYNERAISRIAGTVKVGVLDIAPHVGIKQMQGGFLYMMLAKEVDFRVGFAHSERFCGETSTGKNADQARI